MIPPSPIMMAGVAQKMLRILSIDCPPDYRCGGPAYAATCSVDSILHLMGIGIGILQKRDRGRSADGLEKAIMKNVVCGDSVIDQFIQHKSQILSGALHCILADLRHKDFRECPEVTEKALLSLMRWYFEKSKSDPADFMKKLAENNHDELIQLEKAGN